WAVSLLVASLPGHLTVSIKFNYPSISVSSQVNAPCRLLRVSCRLFWVSFFLLFGHPSAPLSRHSQIGLHIRTRFWRLVFTVWLNVLLSHLVSITSGTFLSSTKRARVSTVQVKPYTAS